MELDKHIFNSELCTKVYQGANVLFIITIHLNIIICDVCIYCFVVTLYNVYEAYSYVILICVKHKK